MEKEPTQETPTNAYGAGKEFYDRRINELAEKFNGKAFESNFEALELMEEVELLRLKRDQLERRHNVGLI